MNAYSGNLTTSKKDPMLEKAWTRHKCPSISPSEPVQYGSVHELRILDTTILRVTAHHARTFRLQGKQ
jgi:hypothetical protein